MKKNIIIGFHNPYLIIENYKLIIKISRLCNIYLITTDHYLSKKNKKTFNDFKKKKIIKDYLIFNRYFLNSNNLNIFKIILNYFYNVKKIDLLKRKKIHLCILGSNVLMWERIITEKIIDKNCKLYIYQPDMLTLPLKTIKEIYDDIPIEKVISKVHKSRQLIINKSNKISNKRVNFMGILNNKIDLFERIIIGKFFFQKKFVYRSLDLNTWMDAKVSRINAIFTYFQTLKIYWKKIYPKINVKLITKENTCKCKSLNYKKKLLLLGDNFEFPKNIKKKNFSSLKRDIKVTILKYKKNIFQIDFKPHPGSFDEVNLEVINFLKYEFKNLKINLLDKSISLDEISCNYSIAAGAFGTGLFKIKQACNYCIVVGMTSQSKYYYILNGEDGKNCWLKVKNTEIGIIKDDGSFFKDTFSLRKKKLKLSTFFNEVKKELKN